jgi:hypothetical protein
MKFILHTDPDDIIIAARAGKVMLRQPDDCKLLGVTYGVPGLPVRWEASCKRNKAGITVWLTKVTA